MKRSPGCSTSRQPSPEGDEDMQSLWLVVFGLIVCGWFVVDGAVLGSGIALSVLGRGEQERRRIRTAVGPFLLAGEMWLIAAAGVVIGAFPGLERVLGASYPVVTVMLAAWMLRDAALWLGRRGGGGRGWDRVWTAASVVFAYCVGMLLGIVAHSVPGAGTVAPHVMFGPVSLSFGLLIVGLVTVHGVVFTRWRVPAVTARARRILRRLVPCVAVAASVATVTCVMDHSTEKARWPVAVVAVVATGATVAAARWTGDRPGKVLWWSAIGAASLPAAVGLELADSLRATALATGPLIALTVPIIVVVIGHQGWLWWMFRHPVRDTDTVLF
jgi:cytochrome bd-type quinol oxidase subunit 2